MTQAQANTIREQKNTNTSDKDKKTINCLPDAVRDLLARGIPPAWVALVIENYHKLVDQIARSLAYRFHFDFDTGMKFASSALLYTLAGLVEKNAQSITVDQWAGLARWKARNLAYDLCNARKRSHEYSYDEIVESEEGESCSSPLLNESSYQAWQNWQNAKDRRATIQAVRYAIPKVVAKMRGRAENVLRTLKIARAAYQEGLTLPEIASRFNIKENNLFQILYRFRDAFTKDGRRYMQEYFDEVEDAFDLANPYSMSLCA